MNTEPGPRLNANPGLAPAATLPLWQLLLSALGVAAYGGVSHWLMVHAAQEPWAVAVLFGPLLLAIASAGVVQRHVPTLLFCAAVALVLVAVVWRGGVTDINRMYVLQHAGIHAVLAWTFFSTLRPGGTPLISALAARVHQQFTPAVAHYTRQLTAAWSLYFMAMIVLSLALYGLAPWPWWSLFCNIVTPLAAVLFFVTEHVLRYRWHPEFERLSMRGAIQAWRNHQAQAGAAGSP